MASRTGAQATKPVTFAIAAGLCALVLAAYGNSFSAGFALDSRQLILNDTRVHAATAENVDLILNRSYWWPYGESGLYRPLTTFSYLLNYAVFGAADRPAGYHWFNLAVHAINVLLVWWLAARLSGRQAAAVAAAAVWAVHPLSTEAITNIVGRADLLAASGVLGALACYLNARDATGWSRVWWLIGLFGATTVGVLAKESAVAIAGVVAVLELTWWDWRRSVRALAGAVLAAGVPIAAMLVQRHAVLSTSPVAEFPFIDNPIVAAGFWEARLTALHVAARYLLKLFWPATLSVDYSFNQIPLAGIGATSALTVTLFAGAIVLAIGFRHRDRAAFFFAACAAVTFLPASNLLFATGTIMAERLAYLPSAASIVAVTLILLGVAESRRVRGLAIAVATLCVVAGAARTWVRNRDWRDDVTIWSAAAAASPASSKAHRALAEALYTADPSRSSLDRVIAEAEQSVALIAAVPDDRSSFQTYRQAAAAHLDRAEIRRRANGAAAAVTPDARQSYERAIALLIRSLDIASASSARINADGSPQLADARQLLAAAYLGLGDLDRATSQASQARELNPLNRVTHQMLADVYLVAGRGEQAVIALMVGSMVTADQSFRANVVDVYRAADPGGCAISNTPSGVALNSSCEMVRAHLCAATAEAIALITRVGRPDQADLLRRNANAQLRCGPEHP